MTLQAEMRPEREGLVGAPGAFKDARCAFGNGEGLAMPVKREELADLAEPAPRFGTR